MFGDNNLTSYLSEKQTINTKSVILAEWNMNDLSNIKALGNYRYRISDSSSKYQTIPNTFDDNDEGGFYTNATYADTVVDGGYDDDGIPTTFKSYKEQEKMLFSLEDCFNRFRPRSGINKLRYFNQRHSHYSVPSLAERPRYYLADKDDQFKYWTSFRTEDGIERGISTDPIPSGGFYIDDAAPYVVYDKPVPTNRIVVKMQTHVGSIDLGPFGGSAGAIDDPFYGTENSHTPLKWKIQYLDGRNWVDAIAFDPSSQRLDGSPIIGSDGYVEVGYGLIVPNQYRANFVHVSDLLSEDMLPENPVPGSAYLVKSSTTDNGTYYYYDGDIYRSFTPNYGWSVTPDDIYLDGVSYLTEPVNVKKFKNSSTGKIENREFIEISGIRVIVDSMNVADASFELIELSPRLVFDMTDRISSVSIKKSASDLGVSGMPVGQLSASTGTFDVFDFDNSLNPANKNSVIAQYSNQFIQFKVYDFYLDVNGYNYVFPVKTLYTDGFPKYNIDNREVSLEARDAFFRLESARAPELLIQQASLSYAVSLLLDNIGFSNYQFKRIGDEDPIIPYFYVSPDQAVAEVLEALAVSTQSAMFFDESNNFIIMTKEYMLPEEGARGADYSFVGKNTDGLISNISEIASQETAVYNDGRINYSTKYIQKSYGSVAEASLFDRDKTWIYKPALLWEVSGSEATKAVNNVGSDQSSYTLAAMPLNISLSSDIPVVQNGIIQNNTMNFGESVYWIARYNGYFYANGEIIKYDAVEYSVTGIGNVWVTGLDKYKEYFAQLPFGGKIYPTGRIRIYAEPYYDEVNGQTVLRDGAVAKHGRGQFGTEVVSHYAGISSEWADTSNSNTKGLHVPISDLLNDVGFQQSGTVSYPYPVSANTLAQKSTRNSIIKNFISRSDNSENIVSKLYTTDTGTVQASAMVFNGPQFSDDDVPPTDLISYTYKKLDKKFRHFGTRMRIVGRAEASTARSQTPVGSSNLATLNADSPDKSITIGGSSGGLGILINPTNGSGYYLELAALTLDNISDYDDTENIHNVIFYKMAANGSSSIAPIKLWGALARVTVDSGQFVGQARYMAEENPTVYDVAVEYEDVGKTRKFYIYINNKIVGIVEDNNPLDVYSNMSLFVRGSARCMFENVYAIDANYAKDNSQKLLSPVSSVFSSDAITSNQSFRKYAMSGAVQSTYLSGLSPVDAPGYNMYFEEFGTIMREAAYFNVKYDKAFPALYAKLSPTFNDLKGYTVSGFIASAYGAEFLVFNSTDTVLVLDAESGNYLRIQGVTFTQDSNSVLTVDDYFNKKSDFSNPEILSNNIISSPTRAKKAYFDIKNSRTKYGHKEFTLDAAYIQSDDAARNLMSWVVSKTMQPRKSVGINAFGASHIQLGDLVTLNALDEYNNNVISDKMFTVYSIEYNNSGAGPEQTIYLSEVI